MKTVEVKNKNLFQSNQISPLAKKTLVSCGWFILSMVLICLFVNACIRIDTIYLGISISEFSVTETAQIILLFITFSIFFWLSKKYSKVQHAAILVSGFFCAITLRELDHWFDMINHGFWLYPALFVSFIAIAKAIKGGRRTINEIAWFIEAPYFRQMIASVILLLVFSRIYGMGSFWREAMAENYTRDVKNISEEGIELLCYCLICFSAFKLYQKLDSSTLTEN